MPTQTIMAQGTYNGPRSGGPFPVPAGTSLVEIDVQVTDVPAGANFSLTGSISGDGGSTWHDAVTINCPGGSIVNKQGVTQDMAVGSQMTIYLNPAITYQARYTETSAQPVVGSATITY